MDKVMPIRESIQHHIGQAAQIATNWAELGFTEVGVAGRGELVEAFAAIRDHLKAALTLLGEPSPETVRVATLLMREALGDAAQYVPDLDRLGRDTAAVIVHTQVTGNVPKDALP